MNDCFGNADGIFHTPKLSRSSFCWATQFYTVLDCLIYWTSQSPFDGRFALFFEQFVDLGKGLGTEEAAMGRQ